MESTDLKELLTLRPLSEWHEDDGSVLWWTLPLSEPPYVGTPLDSGYAVEVHTMMPHLPHEAMDKPRHVSRMFVGGWPGYHTHWSPIPSVVTPETASANRS